MALLASHVVGYLATDRGVTLVLTDELAPMCTGSLVAYRDTGSRAVLGCWSVLDRRTVIVRFTDRRTRAYPASEIRFTRWARRAMRAAGARHPGS